MPSSSSRPSWFRWTSRPPKSGSEAARRAASPRSSRTPPTFLKDQHKITAVKDSYAEFVDPQFAEAAQSRFQTDPRLQRAAWTGDRSRSRRHGKRGIRCCKFATPALPSRPPTASSSMRSIGVSLRHAARLHRRCGRRVRLREVDAAQRDRRLPAAYRRVDQARRRRDHGPGGDRGRGLPKGHAAALGERSRQCRARPEVSGRCQGGSGGSGPANCCGSSGSTGSRTSRPTSSPAACASASASPGRSPPTRRSCSWTSRSAPSTA